MKSTVFNLRLNDGSEGADVTSAGKVFHIFATTTGKAWSPNVLCFDRGTTRTAVNADRSRRLESTLDARRSSSEKYDGAKLCWHRKASTARW